MLVFLLIVAIVGGTPSGRPGPEVLRVRDRVEPGPRQERADPASTTRWSPASSRTGPPTAPTYVADFAGDLQAQLNRLDIPNSNDPQQPNHLVGTLVTVILPVLLIGAVLLWVLNRTQGGGGRVMQFGKSKHKAVNKDQPKTTFADVAGVDEAIEELQEVKDFLQNP